jgi:hypothetical protein
MTQGGRVNAKKVFEVKTGMGDMWLTLVNDEEVRFETKPRDGGAQALPAWPINKVLLHVSITLFFKDDGSVSGKDVNSHDKTVDPFDKTTRFKCVETRRLDERRWNGRAGSTASRMKVAREIIPALVNIARGFKAERAAVGADSLIAQAAYKEKTAVSYEESAIKYRAEALEMRAKAEALRERHAWAIEAVPAAPEAA